MYTRKYMCMSKNNEVQFIPLFEHFALSLTLKNFGTSENALLSQDLLVTIHA